MFSLKYDPSGGMSSGLCDKHSEGLKGLKIDNVTSSEQYLLDGIIRDSDLRMMHTF